jgi:phosphate transport system ATP-binding protein
MSPLENVTPSVQAIDLDFHYGKRQVLFNINMAFMPKEVTALIGPSGCGKSTLLRCINRMNDRVDLAKVTKGKILLGDLDINSTSVDVVSLRKKVGMVFQKSCPFPGSIFDNVAYGLKVHGEKNKKVLNEVVEQALISAALWADVKDRLHASAFSLSGGQQQRLCIARAIAIKPEILLMDEPCSALDPLSTAKVEELIVQLKKDYTIVIVTHNMQQALRVADRTAFFHLGKLIEIGETLQIFKNPQETLTEEYVSGRFG